MPRDIQLQSDRDIDLDPATGDIAVVHGNDYVLQRIQVEMLRRLDGSVPALTSRGIDRLKSALRAGLEAEPRADPPFIIRVERTDDSTAQVTINTNSDEYEFNTSDL